jgi:hypothetical protein
MPEHVCTRQARSIDYHFFTVFLTNFLLVLCGARSSKFWVERSLWVIR